MIGTGDFRKKAETKAEVKPHVLPAVAAAKKAKAVVKVPVKAPVELKEITLLFDENSRLNTSTQDGKDLSRIAGHISELTRQYLTRHTLRGVNVRAASQFLQSAVIEATFEHLL